VKAVHNLIADTAKAIAQEAYEAIAHDNAFYAEWPTMDGFVTANWRMFVDDARTQLMRTLIPIGQEGGLPVYALAEVLRDQVYDALKIDGSMRKDPSAPKVRTKSQVLH
jgi:hypothetical protein